MSIEGIARSPAWNRLLRYFGSHFDEQHRVVVIGTLPSGDDVIVRFLAARACQFVNVHVQHDGVGGGGAAYDAATFVSETRVDCRENRQQDHTVTRSTADSYYVWLIPEQLNTESGTYTQFDGDDGADQMAMIDLGVR